MTEKSKFSKIDLRTIEDAIRNYDDPFEIESFLKENIENLTQTQLDALLDARLDLQMNLVPLCDKVFYLLGGEKELGINVDEYISLVYSNDVNA